MNSSVKTASSKGINAIRRYVSACDSVMSGYQRSMESARHTAQKFKDESGYIKEQREKHTADARDKLSAAEKELAGEMAEAQASLRKALAEHIAMPPRKEYLDLLRAYRDFSVPITRGELEALISGAGGNYFCQRALATIAKQNGWTVTQPDADAYTKLLDSFNQFLQPPFTYCSDKYMTEGIEIYGSDFNNRAYGAAMKRADGSVYRNGFKVDTIYLSQRQSAAKTAVERLEKISEEWSRDFVMTIEAYKEEYKQAGFGDDEAAALAESKQRISDAAAAAAVEITGTDAAVESARRIGEARQRAADESARILEAYVNR